MGMDVYGESPKSEVGKYFRNSCWYWRPLWDFVAGRCRDIISEEEHKAGHYNDDLLIDKQKAERIAERLLEMCFSGMVLDVEREFKDAQERMPNETCYLCHGSGVRKDMVVRNGCNACHGTGLRRPSETYYQFLAENVLEFAEFARDSGGFRIR